jgi:protein phosphatase-4 regulatory subunit 3
MCIGIKDEFYNRYMIKNNLFAELFDVFKNNKYKDNLVCSAVLELLEFVRSVSTLAITHVQYFCF